MVCYMMQGVPFAAGGALFGVALCWGFERVKKALLWLKIRRETKRRERQAEEFERCALVIQELNPQARVERYSVPAACWQSQVPSAPGQKDFSEVTPMKAGGSRVPPPPPPARGALLLPDLAEDHEETCHLIRALEDVLVHEDDDEDGTVVTPAIPFDLEPHPASQQSETTFPSAAAPATARPTAPVGAPSADESAVRRVPAVWLRDPDQGDESEEFTCLHVRVGDIEDVAHSRVQEHASSGADRAINPDVSEAETCVAELLTTFEVRRRLAEMRGEA
jgi:hypothetical protein